MEGSALFQHDAFAVGRLMPGKLIPDEFALHPLYPNPFNARATVGYDLPIASSVRMELFDMSGRLVEVLVNDEKPAGHHSVVQEEQVEHGDVYKRVASRSFSPERSGAS